MTSLVHNDNNSRNAEPLWDFVVVVTFLCSLGFPGNFGDMFGSISKLILYGPFILQIIVMLMSSGDDLLEVKLLDLKFKFMPIYCLLIIWFVLSIIVTNYMQEQIIACVRFSVTAIFAIWLIRRYDLDRILLMVYYAQVAMVIFTLLHYIIFPGSSFSYEATEKAFCGLFTTKNPCAMELSFGIVYQTLLFKRFQEIGRRLPKYFFPVLGIQLVFMVMCKSTGAFFYTGVTVFCLFFFSRKDKDDLRLPLGLIHVCASVGFLIASLTILPFFKPFFDLIGKDVTLTNRTPMWQQLINVMVNNHSFTGFGFTMFWKDWKAYKLFHEGFRRNTWGNTMTYGAHNSLLEIWLDTGLIGLTAYFLMFLISMRNVGKMEKIEYEFCEVYIIWQTMKGLLERSYIPFNYQTLFLFMTIAIACNAAVPKKKKMRIHYGQDLETGNEKQDYSLGVQSESS